MLCLNLRSFSPFKLVYSQTPGRGASAGSAPCKLLLQDVLVASRDQTWWATCPVGSNLTSCLLLYSSPVSSFRFCNIMFCPFFPCFIKLFFSFSGCSPELRPQCSPVFLLQAQVSSHTHPVFILRTALPPQPVATQSVVLGPLLIHGLFLTVRDEPGAKSECKHLGTFLAIQHCCHVFIVFYKSVTP